MTEIAGWKDSTLSILLQTASLLIQNLTPELSGELGFIPSEIKEDVDHAGLSEPLSHLKTELQLPAVERLMSSSVHKI
jgi:hypothetical protein